MLMLRDLPKYETLQRFAQRYPDMDTTAVEAFLMLLRVASDLIEGLNACLARHGLLQGRWWVLVLLMREDDLTASPSGLAEKAGVTRATMTGLLDGLERAGLIERIADAVDRRRTSVRMTTAGQERMDAVMPDYYSRVAALMADLDDAERRQLIGMLEQVGARVSLLKLEPAH